MEKFAILGGTFDPPHNAHIEIAKRAVGQFSLNRVSFIPAGNPWHKEGNVSDYNHRFEMTKLLVSDINYFEVSNIENDTSKPTYTIDTLKKIENIENNYMIIGADVAKNITTWKNYEEIIEYTKILIAPRGGVTIAELDEAFPGPYDLIQGEEVDLHSTFIRERLNEINNIQNIMPNKIFEYIQDNSLYG